MDKLREKFEEAEYSDHLKTYKGTKPFEKWWWFRRYPNGQYKNHNVEGRWQGFQLCYEALQQSTEEMIDAGMEEFRFGEEKLMSEWVRNMHKAMLQEFGGSDE